MDNQEQLMEQQQEEHQEQDNQGQLMEQQEFQEHQEPIKVLHRHIKKLLELELEVEVDQDQVIHSRQRSHEKND